MKKIIYSIFTLYAALTLSSCATAPMRSPVIPERDSLSVSPLLRQDLYHAVGPGETLWRISKMYDVKVDDLMKANKIKWPQDLEIGQRLFIPKAAPIRPVIPLTYSNKWKFIIIHHSATDEGSALEFNKAHYVRGFEKGLGYHFVIDNGSKGKADGQIETSPRWIKQENGAHCKASGMNYRGIGICLVGNFSQDHVSEKQIESLVYLVRILKKYYNIPSKNILGHGQVYGARTECPGKYFPYEEFRRRLNSR